MRQRLPTDWKGLLGYIRQRSVVDESGCWIWQRYIDTGGYGRMCLRGRVERVFRIAWCAQNERDWPADKHGLHSCDVRACVNPDHIRPGTCAQNVQDAWDRGGLRRLRLQNRSHCKHGHRFTPENTVTYPSIAPAIRCRRCQVERDHAKYMKRRSK